MGKEIDKGRRKRCNQLIECNVFTLFFLVLNPFYDKAFGKVIILTEIHF